jgi:Ca2+-binding RTX toxin-like protein
VALAEFVSDAPSTGSNDGAVDPRAIDPFIEVDTTSSVMLRAPELVPQVGGDDDLRGGDGDDVMYGGGGDDILSGGADDDTLSGDEGADRLYGGAGDDILDGGVGDDKLEGGVGNDRMSGGDGKDYINAGTGDDFILGGSGADKIVGGTGSDTIEGGSGDDHMWGGNWWKDGDADTFIVSSGSGKDMIHDFETEHDAIDLSSYGIEFSDLSSLVTDKGWATEIDLSGLKGGQDGDKLILKSVDANDLDEDNFIL